MRSTPATSIRVYRHGDHLAIAEIFVRAVHEIASEVYSPEQCLAWSAREPNYAHFKKRCELKRPFVAVTSSEISGFLELDPDGHIDCAYVHPNFQRRGIVTRLAEHAVETCFALRIDRVWVEASICARPMFAKIGFTTIRENVVAIGGVRLLNYQMEKLNHRAGAADTASRNS